MMYLLGVLVVAFGVAASIALHEIGHLVPAKRFGVKVTQYMVGFGPTIWSRHRGETEYGVKAIPLGGYIRMIGMFPPRPGDKPGTLRVSSTGRFSQLMDEARQASLEEVQPGDEQRVFYKLTVPRKVTVMLGGPVMNLLIAAVLFGGIFTLYGLPEITPKLSSVSQCVDVKQAGQTSAAACTPDMPVAPANAAGLKPGDKLLSIAGTKVSTWDDVRKAIRGNLDKPMTIVYERDGQTRTVVAKPLVLDLPVYDDQGQPITNDAGKVVTERAGFLGTSGTPEIVPQPVTAVPALIGEQIARTAGVVLKIPEKMVGVAKAAFGSGQRDPEGPISVVGVGRVAGEVANADTSAIQGGTMAKFVTLIGLIASLNLALFVFNLIPLLPLDGGHVAGALWEGVKRHAARLLKRPDPGYVDVAKALPVAYAVSSVLIVMSVLLIYADIVNPVRLGG
jgi:membrane-associated protease RseP (regulator of RpoE activity)